MTDTMRIVLVTGGNRGIGQEVCRQLAAAGHTVLLSARQRSKADEAVDRIGPVKGDLHAIQLDVTDADSIALAQGAIAREFGRVDVLVNNAAILVSEDHGIFETSVDELRRTFEANVFGAAAVSAAFVPGMIDRGYGRVVNVSSRAGQLSSMSGYAPAYSMSKTALNALTLQLAAATNGTGVLVNSACPGWVRTEMGGRSAPRSVDEGADTIVWLATLPDDGPNGGFFSDRRSIAW
jgi:NAD(P)-dependent dehydrogenase (short-subunit alcohol dehydrogenase family)